MANLSDRIKSLRLSADMTQEEFGKKFGIVKQPFHYMKRKKYPKRPNKKANMRLFPCIIRLLTRC